MTKLTQYGLIAAVCLVGIYFVSKYHNERKARFMALCLEEKTEFDCTYQWDTLMARERAALNGANQ